MPAFFVAIGAWLLKTFGSELTRRGWKIAAAGFYFTTFAAALASLAAIAAFSPSAPPLLQTALSIVAPADWSSQLATVVAARVSSLAFHVWRQAYNIGVST